MIIYSLFDQFHITAYCTITKVIKVERRSKSLCKASLLRYSLVKVNYISLTLAKLFISSYTYLHYTFKSLLHEVNLVQSMI